jgi:hypothetical protein
MREFLLNSASVLSMAMLVTSPALAQTPSIQFQPSQGMMVGPSAPNATANTSNATSGQPDTFRGYSSTFNGAVAVPTPGTVVIRLNGKVPLRPGWTQLCWYDNGAGRDSLVQSGRGRCALARHVRPCANRADGGL